MLRGPGALVGRGHVVQVAAVLVPAVVERLALEQGRRRGQVGDRGHGQVVVGVPRRGPVLGAAGEVLLGRGRVGVRVVVVELDVGEGVSSHGAPGRHGARRGAEAQGGRGGGGRG